MADGTTKEIEDVVVGDMVLATDPEIGRTEAREVVALIAGEGEKNVVGVKVRTRDGVELKEPGGAKVGYDGPHPETPGAFHDTQHISWQSAGKWGSGGTRGNIPYGGTRGPVRGGR
jgi:hypothetical protein